MIHPSEVSAVLVTRGDVDTDPILDSLAAAGIEDIVVWDNSVRRDLSCYGRFAGIEEAKNEWVFLQDDDLVAPVAQILERVDQVRDRWTIVANNRPEEDWRLIGIGSVFHRDLATDCFDEYTTEYGFDAAFFRVSDVVFGYRNAYRQIWAGYTDLPWQTAPNRMYLQAGHMHTRIEARLRTLQLQSAVLA